MHHRRKLVLTIGALVLSAPALSSCGFNYGTDRVNTTTNAVTNRDKDVNVVGAVLIAEAPGSATLSAQLVNTRDEPTELRTVASGDPEFVITTNEITPFEIGPRGATSVADAGGVRVDGEFTAGNFVTLQIGFSTGDEVLVTVPVVRACGFYADLDDAPATAESEAGEATDPFTCDEPMYSTE